MEIAKTFQRLLDSPPVATLFKSSTTAEDRYLRIVFTLFLLPGILILVLYGCLHAIAGDPVESMLNLGAAAFFLGTIYAQRYVHRAIHLCRLSLLVLAFLFLYVAIEGGHAGSKILWVNLFPPAAFFLLGNREGLSWSLFFFAVLSSLLSDLNTLFPAYAYPDDFRVRLSGVYLVITLMMFVYESVRRFYQQNLYRKQNQLVAESQKLSAANTTIRATNARMREREATLESIFRAAPAGICLVKNGRIEKISDQLSHMCGYDQNELLSQPLVTLFPDEAAHGHFVDNLSPLMDRGQIASIECVWHHKSGAALNVLANATPLSAAHQQAGMIVVALDMTVQKQAQRELLQSEKQYRMVVDNAHDGIFIVQDERIRFANPTARRYMGLDDDASLDMPLSGFIHPQDRDMVMTRHRQRIAGENPTNLYHFRIVNQHNQTHHLELKAVRIQWNQRPAIICFCDDITRTKKLEHQLLQAQKMQAIGTLAGGIAHDFNNMLQAITGYAEISLRLAQANDALTSRLNRILEASSRARDLIGQILTFSRQQQEEQRPVVISSIVKEVLKLLKVSTPSTIEFIAAIDEDSGVVMADPTRIHQLVMNLCTNAAHAMNTNGGRLAVSLKPFLVEEGLKRKDIDLPPGAYVQLKISDTGCGMDNEILARIFEPYFTTKKRGEGTGLGLAVVHGIVKNLNGSIVVYSEPDEGTTFNVFIPRVDDDADAIAVEPPACPGGSETILLVDDEAIVTDVSREILQNLGYTVVARVSSIEAYHAFCASPEKFDLVVTDYTMPELTGVELAKKIKRWRSDIPIVMCTGFSAELGSIRLRSAGIDIVLNKPVLSHELADSIRRLLDRTPVD